MIKITGSKIHRVWKCPASAVLPQVEQDPDLHAAARGRGKAIHAYLERAGTIGRDEALMECEDEDLLPLLKALDLDELPVHCATEVAYRVNLIDGTAREIGRNIDRAYEDVAGPPRIGEIDLTLDIVGERDGMGYVSDYKSGHTKYPPPDTYGQTLLGAVAVRRVLRVDRVVVQLIKIHSDGDNHRVTREVNEWDIDMFAAEAGYAVELAYHYEDELAAGRGVKVNEGPWCEHCPAYKHCPAKSALVRSIPREMEALGVNVIQPDGTVAQLERRTAAITVARAAEQWMAIERIEAVLRHIKQEICGFAFAEEIPLPDGRIIGRVQTERRTLDGRIAGDVIEKRYGREARAEVVDEKVSLDRLKRVVSSRLAKGQKAQTRKKDGQVDLVLAEIERLGGVGVNSTDEIKPHVPRRKRLT